MSATYRSWKTSSFVEHYNYNYAESGVFWENWLEPLCLCDDDIFVDFGCGAGSAIVHASTKVRLAVGVDYSPQQIARAEESAKGHTNIRWLLNDIREFADLPPVINKVATRKTLHHLTDGEKLLFLERLFERLSPAGLVLIEDGIFFDSDDFASNLPAILQEAQEYYGSRWEKIREDFLATMEKEFVPSRVTMEAICQAVGFEPVEVTRVTSFYGWIILKKPSFEGGVKLFSEGCLSCWGGRYHYLEPWVGCEHDCLYCYAKDRGEVRANLQLLGNQFRMPRLRSDKDTLLNEISERLSRGDIETLKLCRYTDFLSPTMQDCGLSHAVMEKILSSSVKRVILTTKGVPSDEMIALLASRQEKVSFNLAVRPELPVAVSGNMEPGVLSPTTRIKAAAELARRGVQVTIHLDPIIPGVDDDPVALDLLCAKIVSHGLRRAIYSFMLVNNPVIARMRAYAGEKTTDEIMANYDFSATHEAIRGNAETAYWHAKLDIIKLATERINEAFNKHGITGALCHVKTQKGTLPVLRPLAHMCNGRFYE